MGGEPGEASGSDFTVHHVYSKSSETMGRARTHLRLLVPSMLHHTCVFMAFPGSGPGRCSAHICGTREHINQSREYTVGLSLLFILVV